MKDFADKVIIVLYAGFGAVLGLLAFMFGLGGWRLVFTGQSTRPWNGWVGLILCCLLGAGFGALAYLHGDREVGSGSSRFFQDPDTAVLFTRRLMVIASCLAAVWFLWQMAK